MKSKQDCSAKACRVDLKLMHPLEVEQARDTGHLISKMSRTAFTGRALGEAVDVAEAMIRDNCYVVMTLSGAMTMAGMNPLISLMLERKWINCIVSTGALMGHGLVEDMGLSHFKSDPEISDVDYRRMKMNRVYDVLEPEENLDLLEERIRSALENIARERDGGTVGTYELLALLADAMGGRGVLQTASRLGVPIFVPAFTDSELGLDFAIFQEISAISGKKGLRYDAFRDLVQFRFLCQDAVARGKKLGIFTIGGGVPRNWAQQVGPYVDVRNCRLKLDKIVVRYSYGVRICPDPVHYGHLSGCTYSEGVSWGKFAAPDEGGRFGEVLIDATVGWPLIVRSLLDRGL